MWPRLLAAALLLAVSHAATTTVQLARRGSNLDPIAARSRMNIAVRQLCVENSSLSRLSEHGLRDADASATVSRSVVSPSILASSK